MNRIYKVIWSKTKNCYVVASEFAKTAGKSKSTAVLAALLATTTVIGPTAHAAYTETSYTNAVTGKSGVIVEDTSSQAYATDGGANSVALGGSLIAHTVYNGTKNVPSDYAVAIGGATAAGVNSVAIGGSKIGAGSHTVAIAGATLGNGEDAIGIGFTTVSNNNSIGIGGYSVTGGNQNDGSIAMGIKANSDTGTKIGRGSIAIGADTKATGEGRYSNVTVTYVDAAGATQSTTTGGWLAGVALGRNAQAIGDGAAIALGSGSVAAGTDRSMAVGVEAQATGALATAIGAAAKASGKNSLAVGTDAKTTAERAAAFGNNAGASGFAATALGDGTKATDYVATAVGQGAQATASTTLALGYVAQATAQQAIAIGDHAVASGSSAIAMGYSSAASGTNATAIGNKSVASADKAFAAGFQAKATQSTAVAIGPNSEATATNAFAAGYTAKATQSSAVAVGDRTEASGSSAVAIGEQAHATKSSATAVGEDALATGDNAVALGAHATASSADTIAIGRGTTAVATGAIVIGQGAQANIANTVALGTGSVVKAGSVVATTSSTVTIVTKDASTGLATGTTTSTINYAGTAPIGTVSIGDTNKERTITNVAAGRVNANSTDAINGSQLYALGTVVDANTSSIADIGNNVNKGLSFKGDTSTVINKKLGEQLNILGGATTSTTAKNIAVTESSGSLLVQLANKIQLDNDGSVTVGSTAINNGGVTTPTVTTSTINVTNGPTITGSTATNPGGIDMGNTKITNLAPGVAGGDAVNKDQLDAVKAAMTVVKAGVNTAVAEGTNSTTGAKEYTVNAKDTTVSAADGTVKVTADPMDSTTSTTNYKVGLSDSTQTLINNTSSTANSALQEVKTTVNGAPVKTLKKDDNVQDFVNGTNTTASSIGTAITFNLNKDLQDINSITITSTATNPGGINMGNTQITNMQSGSTATVGSTATDPGKPVYGDDNNGANIGDVKYISKSTAQANDHYLVSNQDAGGTGNYKVDAAGKVTLKVKNPDAATGYDEVMIEDVASSTALSTVSTTVNNVSTTVNNVSTTVDKGTKYAGDYDTAGGATNNLIARALGETTTIKGGAAFGDLTDGNIGVVSDGTGTLTVKLSSKLKDIDTITLKGQNGTDGVSIQGKDGKIVYTEVDPNGSTVTDPTSGQPIEHEVATKDDGIKYTGDETLDATGAATTNVGIKLNKNTNIYGGMTAPTGSTLTQATTDKNIAVVAKQDGEDAKLQIRLAKDLQDINSITVNGGPTITGSTVAPDGTITPGTINMNGGKITDLAPGTNPNDAVNKSQLDAVSNGDHYLVSNQVATNTADNYKPVNGQVTLKVQTKASTTTTPAQFDDVVIDDVASASTVTTISTTVDKGTKYAGDYDTTGAAANNVISQALGATTTIKGGAAFGDLTDGNIGVVSDGTGTLTVKLSSKLKDIDTIGLKGQNGTDGVSIQGKDGKIVYTESTTGTPVEHEVATKDDGIKYTGDETLDATGAATTNVGIKLNKNTNIYGGMTAPTGSTLTQATTDKNIAVVAQQDGENAKLQIRLAKNLSDIDSIAINDGPVINSTGITINPGTATNPTPADSTVSLTKDGLNNGGKQITNVESGSTANGYDTPTNGANIGDVINISNSTLAEKDQHLVANPNTSTGHYAVDTDHTVTLKVQTQASTTSSAATYADVVIDDIAKASEIPSTVTSSISTTLLSTTFGLTAEDGSSAISPVNTTVGVIGDGNISTSISSVVDTVTGSTVNKLKISLGNDITVGEKGEPGIPGKDGKIGVNGADGSAVVINGKDGSIGLNGKDGKDGISFSTVSGPNDVTNSTITRIEYVEKNPDGTTKTDPTTGKPITHDVATLDDGIKYTGDATDSNAAVKLNKVTSVVGGMSGTTADLQNKTVTGNLAVIAKQDPADATNALLEIRMSKDLNGINTISNGNGTGAKITLGDTTNNFDFNGGQVNHLGSGSDGKDAANKPTYNTDTNAANIGDVKNIAQSEAAKADTDIHVKAGSYTVTNNTVDMDLIDKANSTVGKVQITDIASKTELDDVNNTVSKGTKHQGDVLAPNAPAGKTNNFQQALGETTKIVGGVTDASKLSDNNIGVVSNGTDTLTVKLAKNIDLSEDGSVTTGATKVDNDGVKVTDKTNPTTGTSTALTNTGITITPSSGSTVSLTDKGLDNGNNQIVNVKSGLDGADGQNGNLSVSDVISTVTAGGSTAFDTNGANIGDVINISNNIASTAASSAESSAVSTVLSTATFGLQDDNGTPLEQNLNHQIQIVGDGNISTTVIASTASTPGKLQISLASTINIGEASTATTPGKDGQIGVNGKDGSAVVINGKDGSIGLQGPAGKDGISLSTVSGPNDVTNSTITRIEYVEKNPDGTNKTNPDGSPVKHDVATLDDGVKYKGDTGSAAIKLNNNTKIYGGATSVAGANNINVTATQVGSDAELKVNLAKDLSGLDSITFNNNGPVIRGGTTTGGTTTPGSIDMNGGGITELKSGATGTDANGKPIYGNDTNAANIGDVKQMIQDVNAGGDVNNAINNMGNQLRGEIADAGANAAALAALKPMQYDPMEPTQIMAGVGGYDGSHALALGVAHYTNESTMFHAGVSVGAHKNMYNAGVTWKLGNRDEEAAIPDRYKAGPISSVYVMQDEVSAIKAQNARLLNENAEMKAQIKALMTKMGL